VFTPARGKHTSKCKVKGMTLNYENSNVVNFTTLKKMILDDYKPVHVHNPKKTKRKHVGIIVSQLETKEYKVAFKNHRLINNFVKNPYR